MRKYSYISFLDENLETLHQPDETLENLAESENDASGKIYSTRCSLF